MKRYAFIVLIIILSVSLSSTEAFATAGGMDNFVSVADYVDGQFEDVDETEWYGAQNEGVIRCAYELGLVMGRGADFAPDEPVLLSEAVTMAARVHSIYINDGHVFAQEEPWYAGYIDYAIEQGIIPAEEFHTYERPATRAEMAYIFASALPGTEFGAINSISELPDVDESTKYSESIFALYNAGILKGNDKYGTFEPDSEITRAAASAIISRIAVPGMRQTFLLIEPLLWGNLYEPGMRLESAGEIRTMLKSAFNELIPNVEFSISPYLCEYLIGTSEFWSPSIDYITYRYDTEKEIFFATIYYRLYQQVLGLIRHSDAVSERASEEAVYYYNLLLDEKASAPTGFSAYERAAYYHDSMITAYSYDQRVSNAPNNSDYEISFSFEGLLLYGTGVCQAYSELYSLYLWLFGIPNTIIINDTHAWNLVLLDGDYYHIDVTFDDPIPDRPGRVEYTFFCLSDDEMTLTGRHWDMTMYAPALGTKY